MLAYRRDDVRGLTGRGDDAMTGCERRLCDIDAHAAACAGDEPNLGLSHFLPPVILMPACREDGFDVHERFSFSRGPGGVSRRLVHDGHYAGAGCRGMLCQYTFPQYLPRPSGSVLHGREGSARGIPRPERRRRMKVDTDMALILVTGASAGLGLAAAIELADHGHDVVVQAALPMRAARRRSAMERLGDRGPQHLEETAMSPARRTGSAGRCRDPQRRGAALTRGGAGEYRSAVLLTAAMRMPGRLNLSSSMHRGGSVDLDRLASGRRRDTKLWVTTLSQAVARR